MHIKHVDGATKANHPPDAVSVRVNDGVSGRIPDDESATPLPKELGDNLPVLSPEFDAEGLPDWAERWCANIRLGTDERLDTPGLSRWHPFGRFREIADEQRGRSD